MPTELTLDDLTTLLRECAGEDETVNLDGDVLDKTFTELNYDSLAVLQTTGKIEREYGLTIDEDAVNDAQTPRQYLAVVNAAFSDDRAASA
ncbi:acyl carrier protein [Streptomyces cupreus]|uniref:Acyl carrier protein n=1 Tax=Streptomyces cupreus TaxID=2759956 RepID=A0A7X1MCU7_9ACTN|nr:acyl carrier protein [Streptomyces cupreus]MBC2906276.1 acyl carrier protein [Streptomyces cupreus]